MKHQRAQTTKPLMPKATAVWLIENSALTFRQIGDFCELHELEVKSIADDETAVGMVGYDPIVNGQLTQEEIARCEADPAARLVVSEASEDIPRPSARTKGPRYTPLARRSDKPDAIAWLVKHYPNLSDSRISRLIGTTKPTIVKIRERTHWNMSNINARDPVGLGLCLREDLDNEVTRAGYQPQNTGEAPVQADDTGSESIPVQGDP